MGMILKSTAPGSIEIQITDNDTLYAAYMPFLKNGGIFINLPSGFGKANEYGMGTDIVFILTLPNAETVFVTGRVVWMNPEGFGVKRGFGVQFINDKEDQARRDIEKILAADPKFKGGIIPTYTM